MEEWKYRYHTRFTEIMPLQTLVSESESVPAWGIKRANTMDRPAFKNVENMPKAFCVCGCYRVTWILSSD